MVGSAGYLKAMKDTGVLDTVTYLAGKRKKGDGPSSAIVIRTTNLGMNAAKVFLDRVGD